MQDTVVLVTGATAGIGKETALELARKGAQVTLVSRSEEKCAEVAAWIKTESANLHVEYIAADLSTRAGVQQVAYTFKKRHTRLHVLVNNAGAYFMSRQVTADGLEKTFALNHLAYFHLTHLLLDLLKNSAPARIVNVASVAHMGKQPNFEDLQNQNEYKGFYVYGQSKLYNLLFTFEMARRLQGTGVTVNALHPGFVASDFAKNNGLMMKVLMPVIGNLFGISSKKGAQTPIYLASSPEVEGLTGKYFENRRPVSCSEAAQNEEFALRLWQASLELIA